MCKIISFSAIFSIFLLSSVFANTQTIQTSAYPGLRLTNDNAQVRFYGEGSEKWTIGSTGAPGNDFLIYDVIRSTQVFGINEFNGNARFAFDLRVDGNTSIGTNLPVDGYRLTVNGGIYALDLRVRPNLNNTADFVFEDNYNLMPLEQVESNIKANKHLPGIPSAEEMVKEGVSVVEMQSKLLQKIEELTLYIIEQNKEIQALKSQVNSEKTALMY